MTTLLEAVGLRVEYAGTPALEAVDLVVRRGEFVALIGPNGCGKTSLLRALVGTVPCVAGTVRIDGHDLAREPRQARMQLGFAVAPEVLPRSLTGHECLRLFAATRDMPAPPPACLALADALALAPMLDRRVEGYSLGMRQKLGILLGLLGEPPLLLLDEPSNGLDPRSALVLKRHLDGLVSVGDTGVLLATHALDVAERHATRALLMVEGRLRHEWSRAELAELRDNPRHSLEQAMADAMA
jgi:ABC-2 type transport system ATP-binding protein